MSVDRGAIRLAIIVMGTHDLQVRPFLSRLPYMRGITLLSVAIAVLAPAVEARAQMLRGAVRDGTGAPVLGALVELMRGDEHVVRALSDERGIFRLVAPQGGRYDVRVLRIGYRTTQATPIDIPATGTLEHDLLAPMVAVQLDDVQIRAEKRCIVRPEEGLQAAALWEEARKALYATELVQQTDGYRARMQHYERGYDRRGQRVSFENTWEEEATIRQNPFAAIDAETLTDAGYIQIDSSGVNSSTIYYAPDAHVLVADPFIETHCFRVDDRERVKEGLIGLEFEPVEDRDLPDVRGTLWLDRRTSELRFLDYRYTGLPRGAARERSGGRLEFRRLPSGAWIVQSWWIRMPVFITVTRPGRDAAVPGGVLTRQETRTQTLSAFRERGAEVITAEAIAERVPVAAIGGTVIDHTRAQPLAGARVRAVESGRTAVTNASGAFHIDSLPDGRLTLVFSHPRADSLGLTAAAYSAVARLGELTVAHLGIPARAVADAAACADSTEHEGVGTIAGGVRDADTERPIPGVQVVLIYQKAPGDEDAGSVTAQTDASGNFHFCGVPTTGQVFLRAERAGTAGDRHELPSPRNRLTIFDMPVRVRD